jgi:hypothetical protein
VTCSWPAVPSGESDPQQSLQRVAQPVNLADHRVGSRHLGGLCRRPARILRRAADAVQVAAQVVRGAVEHRPHCRGQCFDARQQLVEAADQRIDLVAAAGQR